MQPSWQAEVFYAFWPFIFITSRAAAESIVGVGGGEGRFAFLRLNAYEGT